MSASIEKVVISKNDIRSKYSCNHSYFDSIDSEQKAYWLGFLYGDGYIIDYKQFHKYGLGLELNKKDKAQIESLRSDMCSNHPIHSVQKDGIRLTISSKKIMNSLMDKGIVPNKSYKDIFPIVENKYLSHFVRGHFDADGCISGKRKVKAVIYIVGRHTFCAWVKQTIEDALGIHVLLRKSHGGWTSQIGGTNQVQKFLGWIYKDADRYLERKYDKALSFDFNLGE